MAVSKRKTSKSKNKMRQAGKGLKKKENLMYDDKKNLIGIFHHKFFKKKEKREQKEMSDKTSTEE
jgi:ribosomal protein L32